MSETNNVTAALLIGIPERLRDVRVWRNNRFVGLAIGKDGRERLVSAGVNGQADISGIVGPWGIRLEVEVKVGKDKQNEDQKNFQAMIERLGGIYVVARNATEGLGQVVAAIERRMRHEQQRGVAEKRRQHPTTRVSRVNDGREGHDQAHKRPWLDVFGSARRASGES